VETQKNYSWMDFSAGHSLSTLIIQQQLKQVANN
jgi:hypothetical protein